MHLSPQLAPLPRCCAPPPFCRPLTFALNVLQVAAKCPGGTATCPPNGIVPATDKKLCRHAVPNTCKADSFCNGVDADCPAETYANTAVCTEGAAWNGPCKTGYCDKANGGRCKTKPKPKDTVCRAMSATTKCDKPEVCDGASLDCPADELKRDKAKGFKCGESWCGNAQPASSALSPCHLVCTGHSAARPHCAPAHRFLLQAPAASSVACPTSPLASTLWPQASWLS